MRSNHPGPVHDAFSRGYREGQHDARRGRPKRLCVTRTGREPAVVKRDDPVFYHGYKQALEDAEGRRDNVLAAWMAYKAKHRGKIHTMKSNARGMYAGSGLGKDDYALHRHRGRVYVDRVEAGGTHTTIGTTGGFANVEEAVQAAADDLHVRGVRIRRHQEPGVYNDDLTQLGIITQGGEFESWVGESADSMVSNAMRSNAEGEILVEYGVVELPRDRGWLPVIWENGRVASSTFASKGYDLDEARARARAMADKELSHYVGDWSLEARERPGIYVAGRRGGVELKPGSEMSSNSGLRVTADVGVHRENPSGPGSTSRWDHVGDEIYGRAGHVKTPRGKYTVYFRIDGREGSYRVDMKVIPAEPWESIDEGHGFSELREAKAFVTRWLGAAADQETLSPRHVRESAHRRNPSWLRRSKEGLSARQQRKIQEWMGSRVGMFYDLDTGEPEPTALAEAAADTFEVNYVLDDPSHPIWDWALLTFEEDRRTR